MDPRRARAGPLGASAVGSSAGAAPHALERASSDEDHEGARVSEVEDARRVGGSCVAARGAASWRAERRAASLVAQSGGLPNWMGLGRTAGTLTGWRCPRRCPKAVSGCQWVDGARHRHPVLRSPSCGAIITALCPPLALKGQCPEQGARRGESLRHQYPLRRDDRPEALDGAGGRPQGRLWGSATNENGSMN